jgi:hypothetical protein
MYPRTVAGPRSDPGPHFCAGTIPGFVLKFPGAAELRRVMGLLCELCGADPGKFSPDSAAETKSDDRTKKGTPDHLVKCPVCGQWFDPERTE